MIHNLRIAKKQFFASSDLLDLGAVTALCGKNNSGKTRVLELLAKDDDRFVGVSVTPSLITEVAELLISERMKQTGSTKRLSLFVDQIQILFNGYKVIFEHDMEDMGKRLTRQSGVLHNSEWSGSGHIKKFFGKHHKDIGTAVYIPSKRSLPGYDQLNSHENPQPNGNNILSALVSMNSSLPGTDEEISYKSIHEQFSYVTGGCDFRVVIDRKSSNRVILHFCQGDGDDYREANVCGMGYRDLLIILFYLNDKAINLLLIDEPENHMYPDMQRRLAELMRDCKSKQCILATHSSVFLSGTTTSRHFYVYREAKKDGLIKLTDKTSIAEIMTEIGYSVADNLVADLTLLVEGPSDIHIYRRLLHLWGIDEHFRVRLFPLVGDNMAHYDVGAFLQDGKVIVITDKDPGSDTARKEFYENCKTNGVTVHKIKGLAIENYYPLRAINSVIPSVKIPDGILKLALDRPVVDQIGIKVKGNAVKIAALLVKDDFVGTDLEVILVSIEDELKSILPSNGGATT